MPRKGTFTLVAAAGNIAGWIQCACLRPFELEDGPMQRREHEGMTMKESCWSRISGGSARRCVLLRRWPSTAKTSPVSVAVAPRCSRTHPPAIPLDFVVAIRFREFETGRVMGDCDRISNTVEESIRCHIYHLRRVLCADSCDTNARGHSRQAPRRGYISRPARGLDRHLTHLTPTHPTPTPLTSPTQCLSTTQLFLHSVVRGTSDTSLPSGCSVRFPGFP